MKKKRKTQGTKISASTLPTSEEEKNKKQECSLFSPCLSPLNFPLIFKICLLSWLQPSCGQMPASLLTNGSGRIPRENSWPSLQTLHPALPKPEPCRELQAQPPQSQSGNHEKRSEWGNLFFSIKGFFLLPSKRDYLNCSPVAQQMSRRVMQALWTEHKNGHPGTTGPSKPGFASNSG